MTRRTTSYEGFICLFSIFTIVDWLTFDRRASAVCVSPRAFRSRGTSSRSGIISGGNGPGVHIPAGIFRVIAYYWPTNRATGSFAPVPARRAAATKSHICTAASTPQSRRGQSVARNIYVEELIHTPIEQQGTEIVERKGIGHPDSIADGLAEAVSRALCKMYVARFGRILHHNTDQVEVVGGQSAPKFGGGIFLEPAYILLVGRATTVVNGERLPYRTAAIEAAHDYLTQTCTNLNVDGDVTLDCKIGQGSVDLRGLYDTQKQLANDTSFGVGFAPFSELETVVLQTEQLINGPLKKDLKAVGQDIKVMGERHEDAMRLTIAAAIVDRHVSDGDAYAGVIEELRERVLDNAVKYTDREVKVDINTGDNY